MQRRTHADRFYGGSDMIARGADRRAGVQFWGARLRLKADKLVLDDGGESTLALCFARGE